MSDSDHSAKLDADVNHTVKATADTLEGDLKGDLKDNFKDNLKGYLNTERVICEVFKSPRKEEMYLYVDKRQGLAEVPEALLTHFGTPIPVMTLMLTPGKALARANTAEVLAAIRDQGFYFQMPPAKDDYLLDLYRMPTQARY